MTKVAEIVRRTERLQDQAELLQRQIAELRAEVLRLQESTEPPSGSVSRLTEGSFSVALSLAEDLGPDVSSERPDDFADRGGNWFAKS
jgi:predicted  nucleic acid-binding Zn-ribbon protein